MAAARTRGKYAKALRSDMGCKMYAPTERKPRFRVVGSSGREVTGRAVPLDRPGDPMWEEEERWAHDQFDRAVAWARAQAQGGHAPVTSPRRRARVVGDLIVERQRLLAEAVASGEGAIRTTEKAEEIHRLWIAPSLGSVTLMDWCPGQCRSLLAGAHVGTERRASIGAEMRALVTLAHKLRWLPAGTDPMDGIAYWKKAMVHGEAASFVPLELRPSTEQVKALMPAMGERCRSTQAYLAGRPAKPVAVDRDWGELICAVGGFSGARPGERWGLTAESVLHGRGPGQLHLIHAVEQSREGRRLKVLKGKLERWTVVPEDVWPLLVARAEALMERFGEEQGRFALMFPATDHDLRLVELDREEAERRGRPVGAKGWVDLDTWDRSEFRRSLFLPSASAAGWPDVLTFEHLRHHFATWLFARTNEIQLVSVCMGHQSPEITWNAYFRSTEHALECAAAGLHT